MGRILAISSQVVRGHVGLSAIVPALQRLGHEVLALPTIVLSNHPGHKRAAGARIEVNTIGGMLEVLEANGWLDGLDAMITGYMPSADHVECIATGIDLVRARAPHVMVLVDPVLGDDPRGLYIDPSAAAAIRRTLLPRADMITPNRFELAWLAERDVRDVADVAAAQVVLAGDRRDRFGVLATSVPTATGHLANVHVRGDRMHVCTVERLARAPHGTGDLLTGLYVGQRVGGVAHAAALAAAVGGVRQAIANSVGRSDLDLVITDISMDWTRATSAVVEDRS